MEGLDTKCGLLEVAAVLQAKWEQLGEAEKALYGEKSTRYGSEDEEMQDEVEMVSNPEANEESLGKRKKEAKGDEEMLFEKKKRQKK